MDRSTHVLPLCPKIDFRYLQLQSHEVMFGEMEIYPVPTTIIPLSFRQKSQQNVVEDLRHLAYEQLLTLEENLIKFNGQVKK